MGHFNPDILKFQRISVNNSLFSKLVLNLFHRANRSCKYKYVDSTPCIQLYADYGNADTWIFIRNYVCYLAEEFPSYIKVEAYQSYFKLFYFDETFFDSSTDDAINTWARQKSTPIYTFVQDCLKEFERYYQHRDKYPHSLEGFPARKIKINECVEDNSDFVLESILNQKTLSVDSIKSVIEYLRNHCFKGQPELMIDVTNFEDNPFLGSLLSDVFSNLFCEYLICRSKKGLNNYWDISSAIQQKFNSCMKAPLGAITQSSQCIPNQLNEIEYSIKYIL